MAPNPSCTARYISFRGENLRQSCQLKQSNPQLESIEEKSSRIIFGPDQRLGTNRNTSLVAEHAKEYPVCKKCQTVKLASEMRLANNGRQGSSLDNLQSVRMHGSASVCGFESIPRLDPGGADNQSPMKQDNRDHWTLFSGNLQHLFQGVPQSPSNHSKSLCFYLKKSKLK